VRRTILVPVTVVLSTLIMAGVVIVLGWLGSALQYWPDSTTTVFFVLPFAIGVVTVRSVFQPVSPIVLLVINVAIVLLAVLVPAQWDIGDAPPGRSPYDEIPEAPITVWRDQEVWYALDSQGRELYDVVIADRTVREGADRARLRFDDRLSVPPGERLVTMESATDSTTGARLGVEALAALEQDLRDTRYALEASLDLRVPRPFELSEAVRKWLPPVLWQRWYGVILVGLWALALVMVWTPARATRWPLLNMALAFVYLRVLVALPRLTTRLFAVEAIARRLGPRFQALRLPIVLLAFVLVLVLVALLLPRVDRRGVAS